MKEYRPDIDGLRAVAVLSVLLFHLGLPWASGGYVGVDVFYVISGFLITGIISRDVAEGRFGLIDFYVRRARRLSPALFVTIAASFVAAFLLFSPSLFADFGLSAAYSAVSLSNIFFWLDSGYFDTASYLKPLLHTWSLGVEEQFYLLWPCLLIVFARWRHPLVAIVLLGAASLAAAAITVQYSSEAVFFLMPFRIFEFAIGGALSFLIRQLRIRNILAEALLAVGLGMIVYSTIMFSDATHFVLSALVSSAGAFLVILCGQSRVLGFFLRNPLSVALGGVDIYRIHKTIAARVTTAR